MRTTKVKVEHMEDRLYIHRNYCLQDIHGKTGLLGMSQDFSIWVDKETIQHLYVFLYMMGQRTSREKALSKEMGQGT